MKAVIISGSPRLNGNGTYALNNIIKGLTENNYKCKRYDLCKLNVKNCLGCRSCIKTGGKCVINDDYKIIFEDIKQADVVIISSPIFINQVNGYVKTFLDRCYPLATENHKPRFGKRKLYMVWTYGAPVPLIFNRYIRSTSKSLKAMGLNIQKNIIINGCTTIDKVKNNQKLQNKLYRFGKSI